MTRICRCISVAVAIAIVIGIVGISPIANAGGSGVPVLTISSPDQVTVGTTTAVSLYLERDGTPLTSTRIDLGVTGPATLGSASVYTDATGHATVNLIATTTSGTANLSASSSGATTVYKKVQVEAGLPATMKVLSSDPTLMPAGTGKVFIFFIELKDAYGNLCNNTTAYITVDGVTKTTVTDKNGLAGGYLGPASESCPYNVTVTANGNTGEIKKTFFVYFLLPYVHFDAPASVTAGSKVSMKVTLADKTYLTTVPGVLLTCSVYDRDSNRTLETSGYTDANGSVTFIFNTSPRAGANTIIISNDSLGQIDSKIIWGTGGATSKLILDSDPASPILADGVTSYKLRIWAKDSGGNPVKNDELNITKNGILVYTVTTNSNGYAEMPLKPSSYVGNLNMTVQSSNSSVKSSIILAYKAGDPAKTTIKANPNVIASSEVDTPPGMEDVHSTQIIGLVTDKWDHPLANQYIEISSLNRTAGNITGPVSGWTDENGEFYTSFTLGNVSRGTGTVAIMGKSGSIQSTGTITYTNVSFISMESSITPRNVSVNDTINVDVSLKGIGWNNRPQPVDVMLVIDKSGSMDWYSTVVYPTDKPAEKGTLPRSDREYLIGTYENTEYDHLEFIVSSPYSNYRNGSYYYDLRVVRGYRSYDGSNSANENVLTLTQAKTGTYYVYAKFHYDPRGGNPEYSYSVLTLPLRLGSSWDTGSAAKVSAIQFINNMSDQDQIGLATFNLDGTLNRPLKLVQGTNKSNLISSINGLEADGGTNVYEGMQIARTELSGSHDRDYKDIVIVLTDGYSQSPNSDIQEAVNCKNAGITVYTIGMGMPDEETLSSIANITGGKYYRVASDLELTKAYRDIGAEIKDVISNTTAMDIVSERSVINGTVVSDAEYINNSALVTFVNGSTARIEPIVAFDNDTYNMLWEPGQIRINDVWRVQYKMKVMHGGVVVPVSNKSYVKFTRPDGKVETGYFTENLIFCNEGPGGMANNSTEVLAVQIVSPRDNENLKELYVPITWNVHYTGADTYTQTIFVKPSGNAETQLKAGFEGDRNSTGSYATQWNLNKLPAGDYQIRVYVTDGSYETEAIVSVTIPFESGQIILQ